MPLSTFRIQIDEIDHQILRLLNQRAQCALEIGKIKREHQQEIFVPERENHILDQLDQMNHGPLSSEQVSEIFRLIIQCMREIQQTEK